MSSSSSSESDSEPEVKIEEMDVKEEEEEKFSPGDVKKPKLSMKSTDDKVTMDEYYNLLAKINKCTNKHKRKEDFMRARRLKRKLKKAERLRRREEAKYLGEDAPPKLVPKTLESLREHDPTFVEPTATEGTEILCDEFNSYFEKSYVPKVLITSSSNPSVKTGLFMKELHRVIPNSTVFHRRQSSVKKMIAKAIEHEFTDVIVVNENSKEPTNLLLSRLPEGPTANFKISNVKLTKHIKRDWKEITSHRPEVLITNFKTRLGMLVGRMLASVFHYDPQFKGRRAVTFHNQRDYIFFRHHRYEFKKNGTKVAIRELGPRFTLKPKSLQKGTFDSKTGEYIWIVTNKRHEMETSRRKFFL